MKSVLISIQPKWCDRIADGKKTIEVRKTTPDVPFKCYIYCTKQTRAHALHLYINSGWGRQEIGIIEYWRSGKEIVDVNSHLPAYRYNSYLAEGKVIGEFVCDKIDEYTSNERGWYCYDLETCLLCDEIAGYGKGKTLYGWHISDLKIYDKPKALVEFHKCGAKSFEELSDTEDLCSYCSRTGFCEEHWCDEAYQNYLDVDFALTRAPQSWQYVEELKNGI